jgi:hypothetical protein
MIQMTSIPGALKFEIVLNGYEFKITLKNQD